MTSQEDDNYMFTRGHKASARLVLQHWLWLYNLKYVLHPSIPANREHLKIADVATRNAIWLIELLPHVPASAELDGFDISAVHYPAKEWLPHNLSLDIFNVFEGIPEHLVGRYDVVHIRSVAVMVRNNDPGPLLRNLVKMLKPGGYLQWDEMDLTTFRPGVVKASASKVAADELMDEWKYECAKCGVIYNWIPKLETFFRENGLYDVNVTTFPPIDVQRKAFTDNALIALEAGCLMFSAREKALELEGKVQWQDLFVKAVMETKNGASITADLIIVVGRKAE